MAINVKIALRVGSDMAWNISCFMLYYELSNPQVANICATFELRKYICIFFRGMYSGLVVLFIAKFTLYIYELSAAE